MTDGLVYLNTTGSPISYASGGPVSQNPPPICDDGRWVGLKTVHSIAADKSYSDWEMWIDNTPLTATGVANN
jgi:hypothetical protein